MWISLGLWLSVTVFDWFLWFSLIDFDRIWLNSTTCRTPGNCQKIKINQVTQPKHIRSKLQHHRPAVHLHPAKSICIFGQSVIYPLWCFIPQPGGILHFDLIRPLHIPGYVFHSHANSKIHLPESKSFITFLTTPKLYQIPTQFPNRLR